MLLLSLFHLHSTIDFFYLCLALQDEKEHIEMDELRDKFENLRKEHEELEVKSKAELKVLVKEVKTLRTTQSELRVELSRTMKEKLEMEVN